MLASFPLEWSQWHPQEPLQKCPKQPDYTGVELSNYPVKSEAYYYLKKHAQFRGRYEEIFYQLVHFILESFMKFWVDSVPGWDWLIWEFISENIINTIQVGQFKSVQEKGFFSRKIIEPQSWKHLIFKIHQSRFSRPRSLFLNAEWLNHPVWYLDGMSIQVNQK